MLSKLTYWLMRQNDLRPGTALDIAEARRTRDRWEAQCADLRVRLMEARAEKKGGLGGVDELELEIRIGDDKGSGHGMHRVQLDLVKSALESPESFARLLEAEVKPALMRALWRFSEERSELFRP